LTMTRQMAAIASTSREIRTIEVPVLPYVAKVMRRLYGNGVIHACHNTLRGKAIASLFADLPDELPFPERPLNTEKVRVELNYRIARIYSKWSLNKGVELGLYYEKVVQRMMLSHIVAQVRCGSTIVASIDDFFKLYDIDEDDYPRDIALNLIDYYRKQYKI
jgi:hypothetical protein